LFFQPTSPIEVKNILNYLTSNATGYDDISPYMVKQCSETLSKPLAHIINQSMLSGIVPDELKISKIIPIHKSGERNCFSNYIPIAILPFFSKVLEKIIKERLISFLNISNSIYKLQFGFRKDHNTENAVLYAINNVINNLEEGKFCISIFLDLQKAFDLVDHKILLGKLEHYGIRGIALDWFKSYLSNRKHFVEINNIASTTNNVPCSVPQGSVLGPILFILFINDFQNSINTDQDNNNMTNGTSIIFADDTSLLITNKNIDELYFITNNLLKKVETWTKMNNLRINIEKTKYMLFKTKNTRTPDNLPPLYLGGQKIDRVNNYKFLGIYVDDKLTWKTHIQHICTKLSKTTGILYRASSILTDAAIRMLYYSICHPHLLYGVLLWGNTYKTHLQSLITIQKRLIRIIAKANRLEHTANLFKELRIIKLFDIYSLKLNIFMYLHNRKSLSQIFNPMFRSNPNPYSTRNQNEYQLPNCRTNLKKMFVSYQGPHYFNKLPGSIKSLGNVNLFKSNLKRVILESY